MKQYRRWALIAIFLLASASWTAFGQRRERAVPPNTWEYKIVYDGNGDGRAEERIAPLGAQGWELVSAEKASDTSEIIFFFKRAKY